MARIQARVTEEDYRLLKRIAQKQGKTVSDFVRECIRNYIHETVKERELITQLAKKDNIEKMLRIFFEYQVMFIDAFFIDRTKAEKLKQFLSSKLNEFDKKKVTKINN